MKKTSHDSPTDLSDLGRQSSGRNDGDMVQLAESLPGAVFQLIADADNNIRYGYVSRRVEDVLGVTAESILADPLIPASLVAAEDSAKLFAGYRDSIAGMQPFSVEVRIQRPDGQRRWVRTHAAPAKFADGYSWNGYWDDVTDTAEAQARLRESQALLVTVTSTMPGAVFQIVVPKNGMPELDYVSAGILELSGVSKEQATGNIQALISQVLPEFQPEVARILMVLGSQEDTQHSDFRIRHAQTGELRWLRGTATSRLRADGAMVLNGYWQDTTDLKTLQEELTEAQDQEQVAQQRMAAIFEHTKIGLVMIDEQRNFSNANPSLRDLLNIEDEQEFARDFPNFSPATQPDGRPSMEKAGEVIEAAFSEGYHRFDWMHQTRSGEPRPCEIALTRIVLDGQTQLFATMTDLRERRRHEAELEAASLAANAASRAKSEFLANMSHEIRTPMNAIVGLSHLGLTTDDRERQSDYLGKIDTAAKSLLQIINDILDFSKIEAGKLTLETTRFELNKVLDNLADLLELRADEKGLELLFDLDADLPVWLSGDPLRLGQVLLNLTGNALKFTERGRVIVKVSISKQGPDFVRLRFEISDSGIGMSEEQQAKLFQPFSQADSSTTRQYGGTGLGLVISQRIVDMMDGEIQVRSAPGQGSQFSFTSRFGLAEPAPAMDEPQGGDNPAYPGQRLQGRVLLVEDNEINQVVAVELLERAGLTVELAVNGADAVNCVSEDDYDLVLMDMQMPVMDGIEATQRIRQLPSAGATVPIVAMTANAMDEDRRSCIEAGMNDHLSKPVDVRQLQQMLRRWLPTVERGRATATPETAQAAIATEAFDIAASVHMMGNVPGLWPKLARRFLESGPAAERIHTLMDTREFTAAGREAHTVKGVAGMLGLLELQRSSAALERSLQVTDPNVVAALEAFTVAEDAAIAHIKQNLAGNSDGGQS